MTNETAPTTTNLTLIDALRASGLPSAAAFRSKYGIGLKAFTSTALMTLLTRAPLLDWFAPPGINAGDWEHVCTIVDYVFERPAASSIDDVIQPKLCAAAERIRFPVRPDEDLHAFARRFDARVRAYAARRSA